MGLGYFFGLTALQVGFTDIPAFPGSADGAFVFGLKLATTWGFSHLMFGGALGRVRITSFMKILAG